MKRLSLKKSDEKEDGRALFWKVGSPYPSSCLAWRTVFLSATDGSVTRQPLPPHKQTRKNTHALCPHKGLGEELLFVLLHLAEGWATGSQVATEWPDLFVLVPPAWSSCRGPWYGFAHGEVLSMGAISPSS